MKKTCTKCGRIKDNDCFGVDSKTKDGKFYWCRDCANQHRRKYYQKHRKTEKTNALARHHKNKLDANFRLRRNARQRRYAKEYIKRPETKVLAREWHRRYISKIEARISRRVSFQVWYSLRLILDKSKKKNGRHWQDLVGWTVEQLKAHLESKFHDGMAWKNYGGHSGWQIDHVVPRSWFKIRAVGDNEFKKCWALTNLQPMWLKDNAAKNNKYAG